MDAMTPWSVLGRHPELPVVMLSAGELGPDVSGPLPAPEQPAYLALRDRDGTIGRLVATTGVLDDEQISVDDMMTVFHEALVEQGNPVTWDVLPGSTITALSSAGWEVFLAAFDKAAAGETGG